MGVTDPVGAEAGDPGANLVGAAPEAQAAMAVVRSMTDPNRTAERPTSTSSRVATDRGLTC